MVGITFMVFITFMGDTVTDIFIATTENNHGRNVNWVYEKTDV